MHPRRIATWEQRGVERPFDGKTTFEGPVPVIFERIVIADQAMIDLYELSASERADLESTGALLLQPWFAEVDGRSAQLVIETAATDIVVPIAMRDHVREAIENPDTEPDFDGVYGIDVLMITEDTARQLDFDIVESGAIVRNDAPVTRDQRDALRERSRAPRWESGITTPPTPPPEPPAGGPPGR